MKNQLNKVNLQAKPLTAKEDKIINDLFEEFNKSYVQTKQGEVFPEWFTKQQREWILSVFNK